MKNIAYLILLLVLLIKTNVKAENLYFKIISTPGEYMIDDDGYASDLFLGYGSWAQIVDSSSRKDFIKVCVVYNTNVYAQFNGTGVDLTQRDIQYAQIGTTMWVLKRMGQVLQAVPKGIENNISEELCDEEG